jgi:hypothetical protein
MAKDLDHFERQKLRKLVRKFHEKIEHALFDHALIFVTLSLKVVEPIPSHQIERNGHIYISVMKQHIL